MQQPEELPSLCFDPSWLPEEFVTENTMLLQKADIPAKFHEKIFIQLKAQHDHPASWSKVKEDIGISLQILTGERAFLDRHLEKRDQYKNMMIVGASGSGNLDSLDWLSEQALIQSLGDCTLLSQSIAVSGNLAMLEGAVDKKLLIPHENLAASLISDNWLEGFVWLTMQYSELFFQLPSIPKWYPEHIFPRIQELFQTLPKPQNMQWLTGDLSLYKKDQFSEEMILCGLVSGNPKVLEWLDSNELTSSYLNNPLITYPLHQKTKLKKYIVSSRNIATFEWALKWKFVDNWTSAIAETATKDWAEGFIWIMKHFPKILYLRMQAAQLMLSKFNTDVVWDWTKDNHDFLLNYRDEEEEANFAHVLAQCNNLVGLRWCEKNMPHLLDEHMVSGENILTIGAQLGNAEIVALGYAHNKKLALTETKNGVKLPVFALHGDNPDLVNQTLSYLDNPQELHVQISEDAVIPNLLSTLSIAMESNRQLEHIIFDQDFVAECDEQSFMLLMDIKHKGDRNKAGKIFMSLIQGFLCPDSPLSCFPHEISGLFIQMLSTVLRQEIPAAWSRNRFFGMAIPSLEMQDCRNSVMLGN